MTTSQDASHKEKLLGAAAAFDTAVKAAIAECSEEEAKLEKRADRYRSQLKELRAAMPSCEGGITYQREKQQSGGDRFRLNVGGDTGFIITRDTFQSFPRCRLAQVFSGDCDSYIPRDKEGRLFLDLDPVQFRALSTWLGEFKKLADEDNVPPHPMESLAEIDRWGFEEMCRYLNFPTPEAFEKSAKVGSMRAGGQLPRSVQLPDSVLLTEATCAVFERFLRAGSDTQGSFSNLTLKLLYRASRDGQTPQAFHQKCDNKGPTLTVGKSVGGHVFGAYADASWDQSNQYKAGSTAFLCRLASGTSGEEPSRHRLHQNPQQSIYCHSGYGMTFGGNHDLQISWNGSTPRANFNIGSAYEQRCSETGRVFTNLLESSNVNLQDVEVFEVSLEKTGLDAMKDLLHSMTSCKDKASCPAPILDSAMSAFENTCHWKDALAWRQREVALREAHLQEDLQFLRTLAGESQQLGTQGCEVVPLNVSGTKLTCFRSTLTQFPDSVLGVRFGERWQLQEQDLEEGGVWFDEDAALFSIVVRFLRMRKFGLDLPLRRPPISEAKKGSFERLLKYLGMEEHFPVLDVDSSILSNEQRKTLLEFTEPVRTRPWQLLYRASRDGFSAAAFHQRCDSQGATVVLLRSAGNYVLGGFADSAWDQSNSWKQSTKAFLFRLEGPNGGSSKHTQFQNPQNAIYPHVNYGPTFGGHHDLLVQWGSPPTVTTRLGHTYNTQGTGGTFTHLAEAQSANITEVEVFAV